MMYQEVSNLSSLLKMLTAGRLDAVISDEVEIDKAQRKDKLLANYVIKKDIIKNASYAVFAKTDNGKAMLKLFNHELEQLHQSGELRKIMERNLGHSDTYPE